ncbi:putative Kinase superfamily protein [Cinnamomum micranthum f. kanehirae]|uniref:Putative Kinase superfamily protein n=1 Tax=Cinnamomum micranthum f. kanehirae TaxID=337451 RepID=A0A443NII0_9MAGN|nr:putative Kinase superfamily protein [Cinnamomum micranthum f. kanehirae]
MQRYFCCYLDDGLKLKRIRGPKPRDQRRERFYIENGARLLEESIASCDGKENPIQMFSEEELKQSNKQL